MHADISWSSPLGMAAFFVGLGVFFWGLSHWAKLWTKGKE